MLPLAAMIAAVVVPVAPAVAGPVDDAAPATIRICHGDGSVTTTSFMEYVKEVLPREFGAERNGGVPSQYMLAGAIAVKSYAWYHVLRPYRAECDVSDTTRHQKYDPSDTANPRTPETDAAVEQTWHIRFWDPSRGEIAYAQYCSGSCSAHRRFAAERFMQQNEAREQSDQGWTWRQILDHHYRGMPPELTDWRDGFTLALVGKSPLAIEQDVPFRVRAAVGGVAPGDERVTGVLTVDCTIDGARAHHLIGQVPVADAGDGPELAFEADGAKSCTETEFTVIVTLQVNTWPARIIGPRAWVPWASSTQRPVTRVAETDDPVAASVAVSAALFVAPEDAQPAEGGEDPATMTAQAVQDAAGVPAPDARVARAVVIARSDKFPDALAATGLAGSDAPILLTPGGADVPLDPGIRAEVDRVLADGGVVHLVGGVAAVSQAVEDELRTAGYDVRRHAGATRIETSLRVADAIRAEFGEVGVAMMARAWPDGSAGWADAVTGGAYAAARRHPVLLTRTEAVADEVVAWLQDPANGVQETVILGGSAAITGAAEATVGTPQVTRVFGQTRSFTAVEIARQLWRREGAPPVQALALVDAYDPGDWPWALTASVYSAALGAPQLATRHLVPRHSTGAYLDELGDLPAYVIGGPGVVAPRVDAAVAGQSTGQS